MKDFAAIDFETANGKRSSVCSVGVVVVRNGEMVEKIHRLIRPWPHFYSGFCTAVHGMTAKDTEDAPNFKEVWSEIAPRVEGLPLVAHNAMFDEGCLKAAHEVFDMEYSGYKFYCTLTASRNYFGRSLANHKLPTVAAVCGYNLQSHHHAMADAEACAAIALKIF